MSNMTHEVVHPKLYMAVNGEIQHIVKGTQLALNKTQATRLGAKVKQLGKGKSFDLSGSKKEK